MSEEAHKTALSQSDIFSELRRLYNKGLYLQALTFGESHWGSWHSWEPCERSIYAGRILSNLGLTRTAQSHMFYTWRNNRSHPRATYYYLRTLSARKGPLKALTVWDNFPPPPDSTPTLKSDWLALKASLYAQYRDWENTDKLLAQANEASPGRFWVRMETAYIQEERDQYQQALNGIEALAHEHDYRPAIQYTSHLYELLDRQNDAIALLTPHAEKMECLSLSLQLFYLLKEKKQIDRAEAVLERARTFIAVEEKGLSEEFSVASFNLNYLNGKIDAAIKSLSGTRSQFYKSIRNNLQNYKDDNHAVQLDVPFVRQHHMTCAPATLTAISKFWGKETDHLDIVENICYDGTSNQAERQWANQHGWEVREFKLTADTTCALIDKGIPFALTTVEPGSAHLQAVVGYDQNKGVYLLRDPYHPNTQEMLIKEAGEYYKSSGPRCMVLVPESKRDLLNDIPMQETELYDMNYQLQAYLNEHQREMATTTLELMRRFDPQHRLTLYCERSLARYDANDLKELTHVEALLAQYPEDLNLQEDKSYLLVSLGRHREQLEFLNEKEKEGQLYIAQLLAECLRNDQREAKRTEKILRKVLARQPANASALWSLASVIWNNGDRNEAYELYRLCACLEDKKEGYISSYFKAAQYLKKSDQALSTLKKRIEQLGSLSINPHISYFHALSSLSRDHEGIAVLEAAMVQHPKNGELLKILANTYLDNGLVNKAHRIVEVAKCYITEFEWLYLDAKLARRENDISKEKACYVGILKLQPLHYEVIKRLTVLLGDHYGNEKAVKFIESRLALNPNDKQLLELWLSWSESEPVKQQEAKFRHYVDRYPDDTDALLRLAGFLLSRHQLEEAHNVASKARSISPDDSQTHIMLGDIEVSLQNPEAAKACFRKAIEISVDIDGLFNRLLQCSYSNEEKRKDLDYILSELMKQTSFGNGILEYKEVASTLITDVELLGFLEKAVRIRPDLWHTWGALSSHLHAIGRNEIALSVINKAVARFPLVAELLLDRSAIYFTEQKLEQSEADLRTVLKIYPHWIKAIARLVDVLESEGKYNDAAVIIDKAIAYHPNEPMLHGYQADIFWQQGEHERALTHIEKALKNNPSYSWAWQRFRQFSNQLNKQQRPKEFARQLTVEKPTSPLAWTLLADNESDLNLRIGYLDKALSLNPTDIDINLNKCNALFSLNMHRDLGEFIHHEKWDGTPPSELITYTAWVHAQFQRYEEAEKIIDGVLQDDPSYYDAWRLRTLWARNCMNYSDAVRFVKECIVLRPHNPDTLTLASEVFVEAQAAGVDVDETAISEHLRKSVISNPRDQYNALTWLDHLLEKKDLSTLDEAISIIIFDENNIYYIVRLLKIALLKEKTEEALQLFKKVLSAAEDNDWLFMNSYQAMVNNGLNEKIKALLDEATRNTSRNPLVGKLWMQYCIDFEKEEKQQLSYLDMVSHNKAALSCAINHIIQPDNYSELTNKVISRFKKHIQETPDLWSLVVLFLVKSEEWSKLLKWCNNDWQREDNNAWAVYLYSYGLRLKMKWPLAEKVNEYALSLPEDDYYDRILLWSIIDQTLQYDQPFAQDDFFRIRYDELAPVEKYAYYLLNAVQLAQNSDFTSAYDDFNEILTTAKNEGSEVLTSAMAQKLKKLTYKHLSKTINEGFFNNLAWKTKLFNLM